MGKRFVTTLVAALVASTLITPVAGASTTNLGLADLFEISLDEANQRLYFTAGHPSDLLLVTDLDGNEIATLTGLPGASGMDLSADGSVLFVALAGDNSVAQIDTASLSEIGRLPLPADVCPGSVAVASGYLAIGHSCNRYAGSGLYGGVGVLDPATGDWNPLEAPGPYYQPYVAAGSANDGLFVAGDLGLSPTTLYSIGIIDGVGDTVASQSNTGSNLRDLAVSPDGALAVQASGSPYQHNAYGMPFLNSVLTYNTTNYPNAVEWSGDGTIVATGTDSPYDADVRVHLRDGPDAFATFELGGRLAPRGLEISFDGGNIWAVSESGGSYTLHRLSTGPEVVASQLTLSGPSAAEVGTDLTLSGTLSFADGASSSGQVVTITRSYADVSETVGSAITGAAGAYSLVDAPPVATTVTYTASFAGDALYAESQAATDVTVVKRTAELSIDAAPGSGKKGRGKVVVTATLGETLSNRNVTITAADSRGSRVIASGPVGSDGTLSVNYRLKRTTTFTVDFAGDAWYLPATASVTQAK